MTKEMCEELKNAILYNGTEALDDLLGYERDIEEDPDVTAYRIDLVLDSMPEEDRVEFYNKYCKKTKRLHISMAYIFVGDTGIDIPVELLEGKTEEEQLQIAYEYAQEHIDEIPVADNAEYIADSDNFELEDVDWEEQEE